jgi:hypothetical protein
MTEGSASGGAPCGSLPSFWILRLLVLLLFFFERYVRKRQASQGDSDWSP